VVKVDVLGKAPIMPNHANVIRLAVMVWTALALVACNETAPEPDPTATQITPNGSDPSPTGSPSPDDPMALGSRCTNPEGFSVSYPHGWHINDGSVVSECSQFSPEEFEVPFGTDERVAPITIYIDPVPFSAAASPNEESEESRATTVIDGRQAVRIARTASESGFYPAGTRQAMYLVDLTSGASAEGDARTLFLDTIELGDFEYEANVQILDRMARTLEITTGDRPDNADRAVARYEGGGGGFTVVAEARGSRICVRIPPEGEEYCLDAPPAGGINTARLELLGPATSWRAWPVRTSFGSTAGSRTGIPCPSYRYQSATPRPAVGRFPATPARSRN